MDRLSVTRLLQVFAIAALGVVGTQTVCPFPEAEYTAAPDLAPATPGPDAVAVVDRVEGFYAVLEFEGTTLNWPAAALEDTAEGALVPIDWRLRKAFLDQRNLDECPAYLEERKDACVRSGFARQSCAYWHSAVKHCNQLNKEVRRRP